MTNPGQVTAALASLGGTLTILKVVADYISKGNRIKNRLNTAGSSIASVTRQTSILSRAFIDEAVVGEIVLPHLMKSAHEWYAAQIVAALRLTNMVNSKQNVQDIMSVVQTGYNTKSIASEALEHLLDQECFIGESLEQIGMEASNNPSDDETELKDTKARNELARVRNGKNELTAVKSVKVGDNKIGPMGELYEVDLVNPADPSHPITVPIFVQMQPSIIAAEYAPRFIDMNVMPHIWNRWTQWRAGEIAFFKDFLFNLDIVRRNSSILKDPEADATFKEFMKTAAKKDYYALKDVTFSKDGKMSQNLANSVMVLSEDAVQRAKAESAIDLHNSTDRHNYFKNAYAMMVIIVDSLHQRVTIYFNGVDGDLNLGYADFRPKDSKFDPNDFMAALQAFSTNSISRLR